MRKMRVRTSAVVNWEHSCGVTMLPQLAPFRGYVTAATLILLPSTSPSPALLHSAAERAQMAGTSQRGPGGEGGAGSGRRVNPPPSPQPWQTEAGCKQMYTKTEKRCRQTCRCAGGEASARRFQSDLPDGSVRLFKHSTVHVLKRMTQPKRGANAAK